ncbi:AarF/ABC1/UbiB kinase family protein [Aliiglaciecola litoralis]|uniref:AarF/ABC1/UbiB kinase family protein n=1 Tax=Aliiglaciecola litoralis TaxID=582857 RepID=A0ABN1LI76_9ALTE
MSDDSDSEQAKIPKGRVSRFTQLGSMASKIAGNMVAQGVSELAKGNRPKMKDLLLTPSNVMRVADQLAQMRGAAMKVGQLISMDAGDMLPEALSDLLARLRSDAKSMPQKELVEVLSQQWGEEWSSQFIQFPMQPIAAASIGQVHKAITSDLKRLAIKIQYPGIKQSINSDVDNVAGLIKLSGLLPKDIDIKPLLKEAKAQLHDEANYVLEAQRIAQYAQLVKDDDVFVMPKVEPTLSSDNILAMTFLDGEPVESLVDAPQALRDHIIEQLFRLLFVELFEYQLVQTDPNFANYQYDSQSHKIVLLDFGATREYSSAMAQGYMDLMSAGYQQDREAIPEIVLSLQLIHDRLPQPVMNTIFDMCLVACEPLYTVGKYDFAGSKLLQRLREQGMALGFDKSYAHTPPANTIFLHRKLAGLFLLAIKLKAQVDVRTLFAPYLNKTIHC